MLKAAKHRHSTVVHCVSLRFMLIGLHERLNKWAYGWRN